MRIKKISQLAGLVGAVLNSKSNSTNDTYSCDYQNKAFGGTLLWTNPNPTAEMASNTLITLNSSNYDIYEIFYATYGTSIINSINSAKSIKGNNINLLGVGYPSQLQSAWSRSLEYVNDTTLKAQTCFAFNKDNTYDDNTKSIPLYIIGYNTGLFNTTTQASDEPVTDEPTI